MPQRGARQLSVALAFLIDMLISIPNARDEQIDRVQFQTPRRTAAASYHAYGAVQVDKCIP